MNRILEHLGRGLMLLYEAKVSNYESDQHTFIVKVTGRVSQSVREKLSTNYGWIEVINEENSEWLYPLN